MGKENNHLTQETRQRTFTQRVDAIKDAWIWPAFARYAGFRKLHARRMGLRADIHAGETVVELGAGSPQLFFTYAEKVGPHGAFYAVDANPTVVERGKKKLEELLARSHDQHPNISYIQADATNMKDRFADATVDTVIASNLTSEPGLGGEFRFIKEANRVLKPGGKLVSSFSELILPIVSLKQARAARRAGFQHVHVRPGLPTLLGWNWYVEAQKPIMSSVSEK